MTPSPPPPMGPPAKKSNVLLWIVVGVGGFVALVALVVVAGGLFLIHKAREAGLVRIDKTTKGSILLKSPGGAMQFGGDVKVPAWVPDYPRSKPQNGFSTQGKDGRTGTFAFKTRDSADHVVKFYRDELESAGLEVATVVNSGSRQMITSEDKIKQHTVMVMTGSEGNETTVSVTYRSK